MTGLGQIYKCKICGNVTEVIHAGAGELVCCGAPMELQNEKSEDAGMEKHVPVVEKTDQGVLVKVGSASHPMETEHFIEWIEIESEHGLCRKRLTPGDQPLAEFLTEIGNPKARAYCNMHGLWKN